MGFTLLINVVHWGYNPLTNHLLTSWDIKEGGSWPQISTHGPGPQNHLRCRYCVRSHASPPSWSPSSLEFESGSELGMPQGGENCRFRGWPLKIGQSFPSPNINIGSLQEEGDCTSSGQLWPNHLFFSTERLNRQLCPWSMFVLRYPTSPCKSKMMVCF